MLIGCFSPIVRIFIPEFQNELMENPDKIYKCDKGWPLSVYRPTGAYIVKFGVPKEEQNVCLLDWLAGSADKYYQSETDLYGVVRLPLGHVETGELFSLLEMEKDDAIKHTASLKRKLKDPIESARADSEMRVMRAVNTVFVNLRKQIIMNKENKEQTAIPSKSEYLCTIVMRKKYEAEKSAEMEIAAKLEAAMEDLATKIVEK